MKNTPTKHYIPKHAHKKAIAYFMKLHGCTIYPLREVNGMHGGLVHTVDRKKPVAGMVVYFQSFHDGFRRSSSILRFERTF
jgi:hypothetical protein